ncbi:MAG: hypothetical protein WD749_09505 [Phycisphaerales bacterium]
MLIVLLVIFAIMGLLIGGIRQLSSSAQATADKASVLSLKQAVEQFRQQMGFLPPLMKDRGDVVSAAGPIAFDGTPPVVAGIIKVYSVTDTEDLQALRGGTNEAEPGTYSVYSEFSLPAYILGALDMSRPAPLNNVSFDGVQGPGFRKAKPDGTFESAGAKFEPFFDVARTPTAVYAEDASTGKVQLRDRNGVAYRYYRWEHDAGQPDSGHPQVDPVLIREGVKIYANVPRIVYDPYFAIPFGQLPAAGVQSPRLPDEMKAAAFAIVGAGPNEVFGDEPVAELQAKLGMTINPGNPQDVAKLIGRASADNAVEVGR